MAASPSYRVVPTKLPYINPSQRSLKGDQIGPSSHKNEYSLGVLSGNWIEEVSSFEKAAMDVPMAATSVAKASYASPPPMEQLKPRVGAEMEKELLFGHGEDIHQRSLVTTNQLFYSDPNEHPTLKTNSVMKLTGFQTMNEKVLQKRKQWEAEGNQDQFATTKNGTIDSTARELSEKGYDFVVPSASKWGDSVKSLSQSFQKVGLRKPVPLYRTPLVMPRK